MSAGSFAIGAEKLPAPARFVTKPGTVMASGRMIWLASISARHAPLIT